MSDEKPTIQFSVDGKQVEVAVGNDSLLSALRESLGVHSVKDGCSPQGQCGCCTVLVDGQPRVACVTPTRRVAGREITTLDGLDPERRASWAEAFCSTGASQCGFCTPGIVVRLDALDRKLAEEGPGHDAVDQALLAHLCRCTGWQTITEAWDGFRSGITASGGVESGRRDLAAAARRSALEGGVAQAVGPQVALGEGGFAADTAPDDALVAVSDGAGGWVLGETATEARALVAKVQGRRTTAEHLWPLEVPAGEWVATLRTTWVDPAYLETDASWCEPGGEPYSAVANGGAFGAKAESAVAAAARALSEANGRAVLVLASREEATRWGPKRPPVAGGIDGNGAGILRVVRTPGIVEAIASVAPDLQVEEVDVAGPPTSSAIRAAGWAEALILSAGVSGAGPQIGRQPGASRARVTAPNGAEAEAEVADGTIAIRVRCGEALDEVVLRSYCIGAAHMAWSWLTSEALTIDAEGTVHDLTVRSFGVLRAIDTPPITVEIDRSAVTEAINGSDAVFAAVAAAGWLSLGCGQDWPLREQQ